jgi:hypothetical protein
VEALAAPDRSVSQHTNDLFKVQEELSFLDTIDKIMLSERERGQIF